MNDDTLTLYYYNDGLTTREREQVASALATDASIGTRYRELCAELESLIDPEPVSPPSDMVQRWHDSIDRVAGQQPAESPRPVLHTWSFIWGAAITAALAIGIGIGMFIGGDDETTSLREELIAGLQNTYREESTPFKRALQVHLRESEQGLASMSVETTGDRMLLIMDIIDQNRLYVRAAEQNDDDRLARVLRVLEIALVQLAADDVTPQDAEELRAKLLFELNVMLTKLGRATSDEPQSI